MGRRFGDVLPPIAMTKKVRVLLSGLPLLLLASAAADHVAIGPVRFGVTPATAMSKMAGLKHQLTRLGPALTAGEVRKNLLYVGTKRPGKLQDRDDAVLLVVALRTEGHKVNAVEFRDTISRTSGEWDTAMKDLWLQLRDICDSKFERPPRAVWGQWPEKETLPAIGFTATDTWEYEGIKVELGLMSLPPASAENRGVPAVVLLRATNPLTK